MTDIGQSSELTIPNAPVLRGAVVGSFAHITIRDRLPIILTKVIDTLYKHRSQCIMSKQDKGGQGQMKSALPLDSASCKTIIEGLDALKYNMARDRPFERLLKSTLDIDTVMAVEHWNAVIAGLEERDQATWFRAPWLFAECWMYRQIQELVNQTCFYPDTSSIPSTAVIENSDRLSQAIDVFAPQKRDSFHGSLPSIHLLASQLQSYHDQMTDLPQDSNMDWSKPLRLLLHYSLWGNQADLSLHAAADASKFHETQAASTHQIEAMTPKIIVDHTQAIVALFLSSINSDSTTSITTKESKRLRIDVVLDNAGFELFSDFCLLDVMTALGIASSITLHVKAIPWFVSDAMTLDIYWMMEECAGSDHDALRSAGIRWKDYVSTGRWSIHVDPFWTLPDAYRSLPKAAVYQEHLSKADVVLFKGDLNYRKMVYDADWPVTTPFTKAIGPMYQPNTPTMIMLRTCKSDPVVGLSDEMAVHLSSIPNWRTSGQYGIIQLCLHATDSDATASDVHPTDRTE